MSTLCQFIVQSLIHLSNVESRGCCRQMMLYITLEEEYVKVPLCEVIGAYDGTVGINVGAKETSRFIAYVNIIVLLYLVACKIYVSELGGVSI